MQQSIAIPLADTDDRTVERTVARALGPLFGHYAQPMVLHTAQPVAVISVPAAMVVYVERFAQAEGKRLGRGR